MGYNRASNRTISLLIFVAREIVCPLEALPFSLAARITISEDHH